MAEARTGAGPAGPAGLAVELDRAVAEAQARLMEAQHPDGYWVGTLEADVSVGAGYLPLLHFLTGTIPADRARRIAAYLYERQNPDGSWSAYEGGAGDLSVSVQTYFALKLAGAEAQSPELSAARQWIRSAGGLESVNTITRIWLALFGQVGWEHVPTIPPELILWPRWAPFSIYRFASWSRATIVALMAVTALRPVRPVPSAASLVDISGCAQWDCSLGPQRPGPLSWEAMFLRLDRLFKRRERSRYKPLRKRALRRVQEWILSRQEEDGGWGGILLPWVYSLIALRALGHPADGPVIAASLRGLEGFFVESGDGLWLQPATSPVWDTAWAVMALRESGLPPAHPSLQAAARWLLGQEITREGDWKIQNPRLQPGCWAFEFVNRHYPDLDDTALVPRALSRVRLPESEERGKQQAIDRGAAWIEGMQSRGGGWAAFDRNNTARILSHIPYGDFMTPLDPPSADVTGHVLELLTERGARGRGVRAGVSYLRQTQEADGAWYGRWGVNYVYGTSLAVAALAAAARAAGKRPGGDPSLQRGVAWLVGRQNPDGGWGESCRSYDDPALRGLGASTPSQTSWAVLALTAAAEHDRQGASAAPSAALRRGVDYLLARQREDGTWEEPEYTGTGFPRAFYLRYDLYRVYFPLLALARYRSGLQELSEAERRFAATDPARRILLISHCLRHSVGCRARSGPDGLECRGCSEDCAVHRLTAAAREAGYMGSCVAPGGRMALRFVQKTRPLGIVAVACSRELEEGTSAVAEVMSKQGPAIVTVPLTKDGCVDTEVDVQAVLRIIELKGNG